MGSVKAETENSRGCLKGWEVELRVKTMESRATETETPEAV
jgi:hypothetical protein